MGEQVEPEVQELIRLLVSVLEQLNAWLADAPREESSLSRWLAPLLPALIGVVGGAGAVAWLTRQVQLSVIDHQEKIRAFDEVLSPLLEALLNARRPWALPGSGKAGAAMVRFSSIKPQWNAVRQLLRHPLHIHLPDSVLATAHEWEEAENKLESIWDDGARTGRPAERAAFVLFVGDVSRGLDRLPDEDIDRATRIASVAPGEDTLRDARDGIRADLPTFESRRAMADEYGNSRIQAQRLLNSAIAVIEATISRGPGRVERKRRFRLIPRSGSLEKD